jgi:FixJ family two-component response regulator
MRFLSRPARRHEEVPPWPQHAETIRVLLIDDDEDEFTLLKATMAEIPGTTFELDWANSYGDGLHRIQKGGHHAYLVDYRLGGMNGVDLVREARAAGCEDPLIMLTGESSRTVDMEAMEAGATDFLQKGKTPPHLLERTIRYAITHTETTQALRRTLRQVSGMEAFGRLLSEKGPVPEVLDEVIRLLAEDFEVGRASIYLMDGDALRLATVHGYARPAERLDPNGGRLARVVASGRAQTLPNVTVDPEDRAADDPMELCIPFMAEGSCLGVLNVAWSEDSTDQVVQRGLHVIADRLAVGLALNRAVRGRSYLHRPNSQP